MGQQRLTKLVTLVEMAGFLLFALGKECRLLPVSGRLPVSTRISNFVDLLAHPILCCGGVNRALDGAIYSRQTFMMDNMQITSRSASSTPFLHPSIFTTIAIAT